MDENTKLSLLALGVRASFLGSTVAAWRPCVLGYDGSCGIGSRTKIVPNHGLLLG